MKVKLLKYLRKRYRVYSFLGDIILDEPNSYRRGILYTVHYYGTDIIQVPNRSTALLVAEQSMFDYIENMKKYPLIYKIKHLFI